MNTIQAAFDIFHILAAADGNIADEEIEVINQFPYKTRRTIMKSLSCVTIVALVGSFFAQPVLAAGVPKIGNSCPTGYHPDGASGYCVSF